MCEQFDFFFWGGGVVSWAGEYNYRISELLDGNILGNCDIYVEELMRKFIAKTVTSSLLITISWEKLYIW